MLLTRCISGWQVESLHTIAESLPGLLGGGATPASRNLDGSIRRPSVMAHITPEQEAANAQVRLKLASQ